MRHRLLLLLPGIASLGGMQKRDRLLTRVADAYFREHAGGIVVLALNDGAGPGELQTGGLSATKIIACRGNRVKFILLAIRYFVQSRVVLYGLLGFSRLVFLQKIAAPFSKSYLLIHGKEAWYYRGKTFEWALRRFSGAISVSEFTLARYRSTYKLPARQQYFLLPNALDEAWTEAARQSLALPRREASTGPGLLSVSRLEIGDPKGIDLVLRSLPGLLKEFPGLRYQIAGDGNARASLQALAERLGVQDAVTFLGRLPDEALRAAYQECTVFVLPSDCEGFGIVYLEAMSCGKPVVAARSGGAPEVVLDGLTGCLVEYGDVGGLVEKLAALLRDEELRAQLGAAGQRRVCENYLYGRFVSRLYQTFDQILGN